MNTQFAKATKKQSKLRLALDGPSGSGKTYTALTAAQVMAEGGKIAVIDTERGSASLYSDLFEFDVLELAQFSPKVYIDAIKAAELAGYKVIVIDSLSHAWEGEGGALDMHDAETDRQKGNSFVAWKNITPIQRKLVDAMLQSPCHVIATMRSKMEYVQEKDGDTGKSKVKKVGMAPVQRQGMEYEFTIVGDIDIDHTLVITKSRCAIMADKVAKKPGPEFFKTILDWLNTGEKYVAPPKQASPVAKSTSTLTNGVPRPYSPEVLREKIHARAQMKINHPATDKQREFVAILLQPILGSMSEPEKVRHTVQKYLTGYVSLKEMPANYVLALLDWLEPEETDSGYIASSNACVEALAVWPVAQKEAGQMELPKES